MSLQGNKLSAKADRAAIDEMQFQFASGGGAQGGGGGDGAMKVIFDSKSALSWYSAPISTGCGTNMTWHGLEINK